MLSIRIRATPRADWDEQHTVTAPDGTRTVFETSGLTQTIRDGETGDILGKSTLTADGAEPEAFVQAARGPARQAAELARQAAARTLEAAGSLFAALSGRNSDDRKAVFAGPASEYVPGDAYNERAVWVSAVGQSELDQICPRNREVQPSRMQSRPTCGRRTTIWARAISGIRFTSVSLTSSMIRRIQAL